MTKKIESALAVAKTCWHVYKFEQMQQSASSNHENVASRVSPARSKSVPLKIRMCSPASENRFQSPSLKSVPGNHAVISFYQNVFVFFNQHIPLLI